MVTISQTYRLICVLQSYFDTDIYFLRRKLQVHKNHNLTSRKLFYRFQLLRYRSFLDLLSLLNSKINSMMNKIFRCKERKIVFEKASHSFEILIKHQLFFQFINNMGEPTPMWNFIHSLNCLHYKSHCIGQMVGGLVGPFFLFINNLAG